MKIEIDLKDILGDEFGDMESLAESIERQLVDTISNRLSKGIQDKVDETIIEVIKDKVKETADKVIPTLMDEMVDKEYTPIGNYGDKGEPTTMRKQLLSTLTSELVYKKTSYNSEKNYFTNNIDTIVSEQMKVFKKDFDNKVNEVFTKEAFEYAVIKMQQKFKMAE